MRTAGATAAGVGVTAAGAGATATGAAGATVAGAGATAFGTAGGVAGVATGIGAAAAVGTSAALLVKHGLSSRPLNQTNILSPETAVERMVSTQILRVKHASNMDLLEAVRHCTFLLSEENLQFVRGKKSGKQEDLRRSVNGFSTDIEISLAAYSSRERRDGNAIQTNLKHRRCSKMQCKRSRMQKNSF